MAAPGDRNETSSDRKEELREEKDTPVELNPDEQHHKSGKSKIEEALQQWSNDDERDRAEDDSTPLRSGL